MTVVYVTVASRVCAVFYSSPWLWKFGLLCLRFWFQIHALSYCSAEATTDVSMQPAVVGHTYLLQPNTFDADSSVYIHSDTADVYLYYEADRWKLSSEYMGGTTFAYVIDVAEVPQNISATWMIDDGGGFVAAENLTLECSGKDGSQ